MSIHQAVIEAADRIAPIILQTPLEYSYYLSERCDCKVWLKLEHLQRTGSFKLRGAANKLLQLSDDDWNRGVLTASTGNHGSALAYVAKLLGKKLTIYLPENVASTKVAYLRNFPVELVFCGKDSVETELIARKDATQQSMLFVSPYNDDEVIAGQGTLGLEIVAQRPEVDHIFVPVGGGGLISGIAGYVKEEKKTCQIIGCQPRHSAVMYESVKAGKILDMHSLPTLSDGTAGGIESDSITFDYCQQWVDDYILVSEKEIKAALQILLQHHYYLVEGAAALSVASLIQQKESYKDKEVVLILCGRKLGYESLRSILSEESQS